MGKKKSSGATVTRLQRPANGQPKKKAEPVILTTPVDDGTPKNRVLIFSRDEVDYTIEAKPNLGIALAYLRINAEEGENAGTYYMLHETLGDDGYRALETYPELDEDILQSVLARVQTVIMGGLELPKG